MSARSSARLNRRRSFQVCDRIAIIRRPVKTDPIRPAMGDDRKLPPPLHTRNGEKLRLSWHHRKFLTYQGMVSTGSTILQPGMVLGVFFAKLSIVCRIFCAAALDFFNAWILAEAPPGPLQ